MRGVPARSEALERSSQRSVLAWILFMFEATILFAITGFLAPSLGAWTPDFGVLLLLALAVRGDARALWSGAIAVSAARLAVGVDPPAVVLTGYLAVAAAHAALCTVVDPDRPPFRIAMACAGSGALAAWLIAAHELRHDEPLGLAASLPTVALATGVATGVAALVLVPLLRCLPGVAPSGRRA